MPNDMTLHRALEQAKPMTKRPIEISGDVVFVHLTQDLVTTIDIIDLPIVKDLNWYAHEIYKTHYAARKLVRTVVGVSSKVLLLHRAIITPPEGFFVDHIDGNGLNNRRSNLRLATPSQNSSNLHGPNSKNSTGFKGVSRSSRNKDRYIAQIKSKGKHQYIGTYDTPEEAAAAYNAKAQLIFGEFYCPPPELAALRARWPTRFAQGEK